MAHTEDGWITEGQTECLERKKQTLLPAISCAVRQAAMVSITWSTSSVVTASPPHLYEIFKALPPELKE